MRCIFCKKDSTCSVSVEHIVPESLGGHKHILDKGIVCDKCNNYFARKVEKPFLEDSSLMLLRFDEGLENKRGKVPPVLAILNGKHKVTLWKDINNVYAGHVAGHVDVPIEAFESINNMNSATIAFPAFNDTLPLPEGSVLSRFLGKVALEAFAQRLLSLESMESFIDDDSFDSLRNHVRYGSVEEWPCSARRIYEAKKRWFDEEKQQSYQVVNEFDFLLTDESECYFILAIFGMEYAINIVGPSIDGYENWLAEHNNISPLYRDEKSPGHHL